MTTRPTLSPRLLRQMARRLLDHANKRDPDTTVLLTIESRPLDEVAFGQTAARKVLAADDVDDRFLRIIRDQEELEARRTHPSAADRAMPEGS